MLELFVFSHNRNICRSEIIEKIEKKAKYNSPVARKFRNSQDSIHHFESMFNHLLLNLRSFSNSFLNTGKYTKFHKICIDLLDEFEDTRLEDLGNLVIHHILYNKTNKVDENFILENHVSNTSPYLPEKESDKLYTLVLDLDETLIHYFVTPNGGTFFVRPGAHEFLRELSKHYEIVIFTAGTKEYADDILNLIEKDNKYFAYRLYRSHTAIVDDYTLKDLNDLGRDVTKTIIIDNIGNNFRNLPNNGIECKTWENEIFDRQLYDIMKILKFIVDNNVQDVTDILKKVNDLAKDTYKEYVNPHCHIDLNSLL